MVIHGNVPSVSLVTHGNVCSMIIRRNVPSVSLMTHGNVRSMIKCLYTTHGNASLGLSGIHDDVHSVFFRSEQW